MAKKSILGALDAKRSQEILLSYQKDPKNNLIRHALSRTPITNAIFDSSSLRDVNPKFSLDLKTMPVANQKASGRCWIFAGLNFLREIIGKKAHIKSFELSQNYISLYDKIEKARGMDIIVATTANTDEEARELLRLFNFPFPVEEAEKQAA